MFAFQTYYWRLPAQFTGNQLGSYGGQLNFTLRANPPFSSDEPLIIMRVSQKSTNKNLLLLGQFFITRNFVAWLKQINLL